MCPISSTELKQKGIPGFYFLNLFTLGERPKFIGTGGGSNDEGAETFPKKETMGKRLFAENKRRTKEFFTKMR